MARKNTLRGLGCQRAPLFTIEKALLERFGPFVGNTHSEASEPALS